MACTALQWRGCVVRRKSSKLISISFHEFKDARDDIVHKLLRVFPTSLRLARYFLAVLVAPVKNMTS
jgi:hypothetical protein